jgi:alpha-glucosidase
MSGAGPLAEPHHDGSELYAPERPMALGDEIDVRIRVPRASSADVVALRYVRDGEPRGVRAEIDEETDTDVWWRATLPVWNPTVSYRWVLAGGTMGYRWLNGAGLFARDVTDADDFRIAVGEGGPDWHVRSVVYQVFPDRFATTGRFGRNGDRPAWVVERPWDALPSGRSPQTPYEWYGGDLEGVAQHLDHVEALGANVVYLTPFFPAGSTHRYDAASFERVDPLLGGDAALVALSAAAHARGMRVIGDLTLNHCGAQHEWFLRALEDPDAVERDLFYWDASLPGGYESWLGVKTLPKLDWSSDELRRRMTGVVRKWLEPPFSLDGWRIDVANMLGRYRELALTTAVAHDVRSEMAGRLLVAEHGHDFRGDLQGDGWHGTMNYAGFLRPVFQWLAGDEIPAELEGAFWGVPVGLARLGGEATVGTMRAFRGGLPWDSVLHSWELLDSHDTPRFGPLTGSRERHLVGVGLQMTTPGVPMVFAGDEIGLGGDWGEDARRTMPWGREEEWDHTLLEGFRALIALRRSSDALARGGIRYVHVDDDVIAYLRETPGERLLCLAARGPHAPVAVSRGALGVQELATMVGADAAVERERVVLPADGPAFHVWRIR